MGVLLVLWLGLALLIAFVCTVVGENKGIGGIRWFVLAILIGPFALVAVAAMPDLRTRRIVRLIAENQGIDLSEQEKGPDSPVLDAWNEETQSWGPADKR
jgi:hypothetical protein